MQSLDVVTPATQVPVYPQTSNYSQVYIPSSYAIPPGYMPILTEQTVPDKIKKDHTIIIVILIIIGIAIMAFLIGFIIIWYRWFNYSDA